MPLYPTICPRGHKAEQYARVNDRDKLCCDHPGCGMRCSIDFTGLLPTPERRFSGSTMESRTEGFLPDEVLDARQLFPNHQHCIKSDGTVVFRSRGEQKSYMDRKKQLGGMV